MMDSMFSIIWFFNFSDFLTVDDPAFFRQGLQTGETIPDIFAIQIIEGLGASLIILFIIIYAIKRKKKK